MDGEGLETDPRARRQPFTLEVRNVESKLPKALAALVAKKMRAAYRHPDPLSAQALLEQLAKELERAHPGAAASLREGLAETLTVGRLGVPPTLARTLRSTNAIESMIEICRDHAANVKRWRDGQMALRWCATGMGEAAKQFRRVNGHLQLPALPPPSARTSRTPSHPHAILKEPPNQLPGRTQVPRDSGHPPRWSVLWQAMNAARLNASPP